jgi:hypothetical protein
LKKYKTSGINQISAELIEAGREILLTVCLLILFGIRKNCLISERNLLLYHLKKGDKTGCNNYEIHSKVRISKHLSDSFPIQNGLKQ